MVVKKTTKTKTKKGGSILDPPRIKGFTFKGDIKMARRIWTYGRENIPFETVLSLLTLNSTIGRLPFKWALKHIES